MASDLTSQELIVALEQFPHALGLLVPSPGRPLYVCEQEGDLPFG